MAIEISGIKNLFFSKACFPNFSISENFLLSVGFGWYKCGIINKAKTAEEMTLIAAKIPKFLKTSDFTKTKHKKAIEVVKLHPKSGFVMFLYKFLTLEFSLRWVMICRE